MSHYEALQDNIPCECKNGFTVYHPPCHICGGAANSTSYNAGQSYTCPECRALLVQLEKDEKQAVQTGKKKIKLSNAIKRIKKVADISKYQTAIKIVENSIDRPGWYQSTEEIMAALELLKMGYKLYHQAVILDYKVDFVIPKLKVVLEIDGEIYHQNRKVREIERDTLIRHSLGNDWHVVRIKTDLINKNVTKLVPAIKAVVKYRKKNEAIKN